MDELKRALEWHKQATPSPTIESACVQIGCHYEEAGEMAEALGDQYLTSWLNSASSTYKTKHASNIEAVSNLNDLGKTQLLDALCDQIVTAAGVAHSMGFDLIGALAEVNNSNYSKFEDGKPVFNEQGKISKGKGYVKPNLTPFIK